MPDVPKKAWYTRAEYLAVLVSLLALGISAFEPVSKFFARAELVVDLPRYINISTNVGIVQVTPNLSVRNEGRSAGSFSRITCRISRGHEVWELPATTINVAGNGTVGPGTLELNGQPIEAGGVFLNSVNCIDAVALRTLQDQFTLLHQRAVFEASQTEGVSCENQYQTHSFELSDSLSRDLKDFFDKAFFLTPGTYKFEIQVSNRDGSILTSAASNFILSETLVKKITALKEVLRYGIGIGCPASPMYIAQVGLE